ncbi:hypothetical protein DL769_001097 [Monosporascus sp. CRB-8-3]|nr:hypothetical protein DL769_001097 [Monosporascus sp. CRB-8-3]
MRTRPDSEEGCLGDSHDASTAVGTEPSPSSYGRSWNRRGSFINAILRQPSRTDSETFEARNDTSGQQLFQKHDEKPAVKIISPRLIAALKQATANSPSISRKDLFSTAVSINEPYELIFHNWKKISDVGRDAAEEETREHVKLLLNFIKNERPHTREKLKEVESRGCQTVAFDDLWLIYPPGATVFSKVEGVWRAYKVERVEVSHGSDSESMVVYGYYLDFDTKGDWLVPRLEVLLVSSFSSERGIGDLEVVPDWYFQTRKDFPEELIRRGKRYWGYAVKVIVDYVTPSKHERDLGPANPRVGVWAFSLWHKSWRMVPAQDLTEVHPNDSALEKLKFNAKHKAYLESIVKSHREGRPIERSVDIVDGKGRGLNVLLYGSPGTGKTLTAECLAAKCGVPLYMVTGGDLGTDLDDLEQRLYEALIRATNWKAILLLDEVDVLMQERGPQDLHRNAVVSIVLRHLDYSDALLFMTTNRVEKLDRALESRIHMAFRLPDFTLETQKEIWNDCIDRVDGLALRDKQALQEFIDHGLQELEHGAFIQMNGRQIRNRMSAALALSRAEGASLTQFYLTNILRLGKDFTEFMCQHDLDRRYAIADRTGYLSRQSNQNKQ